MTLRRLASPVAALLLSLTLAACGGHSASPVHAHGAAPAVKASAPSACRPKSPPQMGECVAQHFGVKRSAVAPTLPAARANHLCVDISQWQGWEPDLSGVACVIIQSNYGTHVEPSVYSQIADARRHHIPCGAYTFLEPGLSGESQARAAAAIMRGRGCTLGLTADAELTGTYEHACAFTATAQRFAAIAMLYTSPGLWPGGRCRGYLWPAEWGSSHFAFGGYPASSVKLWQYCGTCSLHGVTIDKDVDLGLIALGAPAPQPTHAQIVARWHRELNAHYRLRGVYWALIARHRCRRGEHAVPRSYHTVCGHWLGRARTEQDRIDAFHRKGIY